MTTMRALAGRWWAFTLLLIVGASRWAMDAKCPEVKSTLASQTVGCGMAALLSWVFFARRDRSCPGNRGRGGQLRIMIAGAMMIGAPVAALLLQQQPVDPSGMAIAMALTPAVIAVASAALREQSSQGMGRSIWPALAAAAALLMLLPQPAVDHLWPDVAFVLGPVLTGAGAALLDQGQEGGSSCPPLALFGASLLFAFCLAEARMTGNPGSAPAWMAIISDALLATLEILSLLSLGAERWSAQFVLLPLLIVVEGFVLLHAWPGAQGTAAIVLLAAASVSLLQPGGRVGNGQRMNTE